MVSEHIQYSVENQIAIIAFNKPPLNVLTEEMLDEYIGLLDRARVDDNVRAVIITSDVPGRFCAGLDLNALYRKEKTGADLVERLYVRVSEMQHKLGKPSIAAVNGTARGGGMTLAIGCDVVLCSENATFGYPEIVSGILPSIHFYHLHKIIGKHRAFELLFTGRSFGAQEAKEIGLAVHVYPEAQLREKALELANVFAQHSPDVMRIGRKAFRDAAEPNYLANVQYAANDFTAISVNPDAYEGISSFIEKRTPNWRKER